MDEGILLLNPNLKIRVSAKVWVLAALSVLGVGLVSVYIYLLTSDLHHVLASQKLRESLEKGNIAQVSEYFELIDRSTSRLSTIAFPGFSHPRQLEKLLFSAAKHYAKALPLLQRRRLSEVLTIMGQNTFDEEMLPNSPALLELKSSGENLSARLEYARALAHQHTDIEEEIDGKEQRLRQLEGTLSSSVKRFQLVAEDFREFMGYPSFRDLAPASSIKVYGGGVLKDLPQIPALRDNILTLNSLKKLLEQTGGKVRARSPQDFQKTLSRIRTSSLDIASSYKSALAEQTNAQLKITELRTSSLNIRHEVQQVLSKLIILYTYHAPQPLTDLLFSGWISPNT